MALTISKEDFITLLHNWFALHNTKPDPSSWPYDIYKVGSNNVNLAIASKFILSNGYISALGYYVDRNDFVQCRHFYKSKSESAWRVGTGCRLNFAWVKGAEAFENSDDTTNSNCTGMAGGYIHEGIIQHAFADIIEGIPNTHDVVWDGDDMWRIINANSSLKNVRDFLICGYPAPNLLCGIVQRDYAEDRKVDKDVLIKWISNDHRYQDLTYKKNQPGIQRTATIYKDTEEDLANKLKHQDELWSKIIKILNNNVGTYYFRHELLNEDCVCNIYREQVDGLYVYIEIAQTIKSINLEHLTKSGISCNTLAPICWVKNCYVSERPFTLDYKEPLSWGEISTFGNYKRYAEDLCFLVQKPMDYYIQTVTEDGPSASAIAKRTGIIDRTGAQVPSKFIDNAYVLLAWYNEKYSPLIQAYKKTFQLSLFKSHSLKANVALHLTPFLDSVSGEGNRVGNDQDLMMLLCNACTTYLATYNQRRSLIHGGKDGKKRCKALVAALYARANAVPDKEKSMSKIVFTLFNTGMVNGEGVRKSAFSKINYGAGSLFSCITDKLLLLSDYVALRTSLEQAVHPVDRLIGRATPITVRDEDCFKRFYLEALRLKLNPESIPLTDKDREKLFNVFLGKN